ncbi:MAG: 30S ribosomal protein S20 [Acidobacteriota bacterium]|nr:30S ribosomal protein S20 [Acidobacteriota bacterium]
MPNHKSAEKRVRQTERRNEVNRRNRSRLRTEIKKLRSAITGKDGENSQTLLPTTVSMIDKMVAKGILHRNAAARYKSRLTKHVTNLGAK